MLRYILTIMMSVCLMGCGTGVIESATAKRGGNRELLSAVAWFEPGTFDSGIVYREDTTFKIVAKIKFKNLDSICRINYDLFYDDTLTLIGRTDYYLNERGCDPISGDIVLTELTFLAEANGGYVWLDNFDIQARPKGDIALASYMPVHLTLR